MVTHPLNQFDNTKFFSQIEKIFVLLLGLYFTLNFIGSPLVKYLYLAFPFLIAFSLLFFRPRDVLILFFLYVWIEGQGRVLWGYASWARIIFDALLAWALFKEFYFQRRIFAPKEIPVWVKFAICLHFLIFVLELFNPLGIGPLKALATSKIYIYPVLLFLFFNSIESFKDEYINRIIRYTIAIILIQCLLSYYQMYHGHKFMLGISSHYLRAMGNGKFIGRLFRPFGTSFVSGGISTYLYALTPLVFLSKKYTRYALVLLPFIFTTLFICQVRSAIVKLSLFLVLLLLLQILFRQIKMRSIIQLVIAALLTGGLFYQYSDRTLTFSDEVDLSESQSRLSRITEGGQRIDPEALYGLLVYRLKDAPLGFGPGLTGAAASLGMGEFLANKLVNEGDVWSYDNFYLSLFTDFGILALVYLTLLIGLPIASASFFWRKKSAIPPKTLHLATVALSASCVMLIGNWGAIGLPYNPESFSFWYWMSILTVGISTPNA